MIVPGAPGTKQMRRSPGDCLENFVTCGFEHCFHKIFFLLSQILHQLNQVLDMFGMYLTCSQDTVSYIIISPFLKQTTI